MKKKRCVVCSRTKAKRKCFKYDKEFICSKCCGEQRGPECEGCQYFTAAKQYQSHKSKKTKEKHFIGELNEEVENLVDEALELVEEGNIREGESVLKKLKVRYPNYYKVNYGIGVVHAFKEEFDQAIACFKRAADAFPVFVEAHFNMAIAYQKKMDVRNMIKSFRDVIEIGDPKDDIVRQAAEFVSTMERSIWEDFGVTLDRYFSAQDEFEKAFSFMEKGAWQKAIHGFEKCIQLNRKHPQSYGNLGLCYAKSGRKTEAIAAFDKALEFDPDYEPALVNKAMVESLQEGENPDQKRIESIEYYKDYPTQKRSYIKTVLKELLDR
ncbi:MAG: tetratricopeptide repeat protein [Deltaproteobacteria bacterium]|nr:tetratricopeptide repeat protein [Deltaproteobacteria bacterium]